MSQYIKNYCFVHLSKYIANPFFTTVVENQETQALVMNHPDIHSTPMEHACEEYKLNHEKIMRRKLKFFFMNPIEKWQAKRRFPYKFLVQVFKIVLVTMQVCISCYFSLVSKACVIWNHLFCYFYVFHLFLRAFRIKRSTYLEIYEEFTCKYEGMNKIVGCFHLKTATNVSEHIVLNFSKPQSFLR